MEMGRRDMMRERKAWSSRLLRLVLGSDDECTHASEGA
jgi:hypothetical protein